MNYSEKARENHKNGYSCSQAVVCAFADQMGIDEKDAYRMAEAFGSGMGGRMETCGAVTGAYMVLGLKNSDATLGSRATRTNTYQLVKEVTKAFEEKNSTVICKELKGIGTGKVLRGCRDCVGDAAEIVAHILGVE